MKRSFHDNNDSDDEDNKEFIIEMIHNIIENNIDNSGSVISIKFNDFQLNNEVFYDLISDICELLEDNNKLILDIIGNKITILYKFKEIDMIYMNDNYDCMALIEFKN